MLTLNHDMSGAANDPHYTLTYSPAHQLASVTNTDADYVWSPAASGTDAYGAVNTLNQYPTITPSGASTKTLSYDAKGNLVGGNIASNGNWTFGYDAENRLRTAFRNNGAVQATYAYDPLGRRTRKSGVGVTETFFLCDGTDEIAEYSQAGTMTQRYVPGPTIDQPIAMVAFAGGAKEYFHTNRQGSVIAMSDGTGAKVEGPFVYDSYGNGAPTTGEPYKFTGRRLDAETGLYFYRARYYWPQGGRFMQTDPVGFDADINLYAYVGNDPIDKADPTGKWEKCPGVENCVRATKNFESGKSHVPSMTLSGKRETAIKEAIPRYNLKGQGGKSEKTGFNVEKDGSDQVVDVPTETRLSNPNGSLRGDFSGHTEGRSTPPAGSTDEIHGHIVDGPQKANGVLDPGIVLGDAMPLERGMTNTTVFEERAGVRETPGGQLQFRMLKGTMTVEETKAMGELVDAQQGMLENFYARK